MKATDIKTALWNLAYDEFDKRLSKKNTDGFSIDHAEDYFVKEMFYLYIKFTLDMGMDPESAYTLLSKDVKTMNALFEDATKVAEW